MSEPSGTREHFREAIEHELARIGAADWRYVGYRGQFKGKDFDTERDAELGSDQYGAVLRDADDLLDLLRTSPTGGGDSAIAETLLPRDIKR
jgi:hypothetical protein